MANENGAQQQAPQGGQLSIQKVYVKDFSFESPKAPDIFQSKEWQPPTDLNLLRRPPLCHDPLCVLHKPKTRRCGDELPAAPFRTDTWPLSTEGKH